MEDNNYKPVTLSTLLDGALEERFQVENQRVLESIYDPNTKKGQTKITMEVIYVPKYDANGKLLYHETFINAHSNPLRYGPVGGATHTYKQNGKIIHVEPTRTLGDLFQEQVEKETIRPFKEVNNNA